MNGSHTIYRESEFQDIPELPGLYAFYVDLVGPGNCGLRSGDRVTSRNFDSIAANFDYRLKRLGKIFRQLELTGHIQEVDKLSSLKRSFSLRGNENTPTLSEVKEIAKDPVELEAILLASKHATFFLPPIYVGITVDQTLKLRYEQHFAAYNNADKTNVFGSRLKASGIMWNDLLFTCIKLPPAAVNLSALKFVEQQLHTINPPPLSIK